MRRGPDTFAELRYPLAAHDGNGNLQREQRFAHGQQISEKLHGYDALDQLEANSLAIGGVEQKRERFTFSQGNLTSVVGARRTGGYAYADPRNTQAVTGVTGLRGCS